MHYVRAISGFFFHDLSVFSCFQYLKQPIVSIRRQDFGQNKLDNTYAYTSMQIKTSFENINKQEYENIFQ